MMIDESVQAVVVQADRVQQTGGRLHSSPGRVADPGKAGHRLGDDGSKPSECNQSLHFAGVAKCARGNHDWIIQLKATKRNGQIDGDV